MAEQGARPGGMVTDLEGKETLTVQKWKTMEAPPSGLYRFDALADSVRTFADVGEREIRRFREDGYLVVREAFAGLMIRDALDAMLTLIEREAFDYITFEHHATPEARRLPGEQKQDYVRKCTGYVRNDLRLGRLAADPALLRVLGRIMGGRAELFQDQALLKPPRAGSEKPWHQDFAYFDLDPASPLVGAWVALDPATAANGCMHVLPGTHHAGPERHFQRRDWQICDTAVASHRDVMVPLPPGGLLLFHALLHHGTPPNDSPLRRRALQLHYRRAHARPITQDERLALFGSEGRQAEC